MRVRNKILSGPDADERNCRPRSRRFVPEPNCGRCAGAADLNVTHPERTSRTLDSLEAMEWIAEHMEVSSAVARAAASDAGVELVRSSSIHRSRPPVCSSRHRRHVERLTVR